jgi:hypothetical protein
MTTPESRSLARSRGFRVSRLSMRHSPVSNTKKGIYVQRKKEQ